MWLPSLLALVLLVHRGDAIPGGLLRVPKVYNAVITSNQNLAPSRAYPVVQPVVHRTAIGYVPPFYYAHLAPPGFAGPGVVPLDPGDLGNRRGGGGGREREGSGSSDVESVETTDPGTSGPNSPPPRKTSGKPSSSSRDVESSGESAESVERDDERTTSGGDRKTKVKGDRVPLSFYPNYQSLYYDPYFYPYNAFPPHLAAPGTYYVDYPQPPGILAPLPPPPLPLPIGPGGYPVGGRPQRPERPDEDADRESSRKSDKQRLRAPETQKREKIPDVPPPPLPTVVRKKAS